MVCVWRRTWKPMLVSILSLALVGGTLHYFFPRAKTVGEVVAKVRHDGKAAWRQRG